MRGARFVEDGPVEVLVVRAGERDEVPRHVPRAERAPRPADAPFPGQVGKLRHRVRTHQLHRGAGLEQLAHLPPSDLPAAHNERHAAVNDQVDGKRLPSGSSFAVHGSVLRN